MANKFPYEDILILPPHISTKHPQPTMEERAARFSLFAAITGYEEMVLEEARFTEKRIELSDDTKQRLNEKLQIVLKLNENGLPVSIVYFVPDKKKSGGSYVTKTGVIKRYDEYERKIVFTEKSVISIEDVLQIDSEILNHMK